MKAQTISAMRKEKFVAILRGVEETKLSRLMQALYDGGIRLAELTFDAAGKIPAEVTARQIGQLAQEFEGRMFIGAGTVLTTAQAELAVQAGAKFLISPNYDRDVIEYAAQAGVVSMPGCLTPSEAVQAVQWGADLVKIFPADTLGPKYFKAICAPLSHIDFFAVGGVDVSNVADFLRAGAAGVGVGSDIINKKLLAEENYDAITRLARAYVDAIAAV